MPCNKFFLVLVFLAFAFPAAADAPLITRPSESAADNATLPQANNATIAQADNAASSAFSDPVKTEAEPTNKMSSQNATSDIQAEKIPAAPDPLQIMSDLRTTLEIRKLQVALSTQDKLLRETMMPTAAVLSNVSVKSRAVKSKTKRKAPRPKVIAVQGIGGKLSAVLLAGSGFLTVYEGDKVGSGTVLSITPDRVVVRYGRTETLLSFSE